jgi:hypothetical protein
MSYEEYSRKESWTLNFTRLPRIETVVAIHHLGIHWAVCVLSSENSHYYPVISMHFIVITIQGRILMLGVNLILPE